VVSPASQRVLRARWYSSTHITQSRSFRLRGYHPLWPAFPGAFIYNLRFVTVRGICRTSMWTYNTTRVTAAAYHTRVGLGFSRFVRHYYGNSLFSSGYLDVSVPPLASRCITHRVPTHDGRGLPHSEISGSACKRLPGAYRSVTTSFFGPGCLGIHHLPFIACINSLFFLLLLIRLTPSAHLSSWLPGKALCVWGSAGELGT
jgi:hypothetical protein